MANQDREIAAAAIAALPGASPPRLHALWQRFATPQRALAGIRQGEARDLLPSVSNANDWPRRAQPELLATVLARRGTRVLLPGDPDWPFDESVPQPPGILFVEGSGFEALHRPGVAIVGTRAATPHGLADAQEIAHAAAAAGYTIVSGLAIGIDAAAHRGAIAARGTTIGVIATGIDVVYPRRHHELYAKVRDHGLIVGEYPFGVEPEPWRFPVRNRIIAALGVVVVVVEAKLRGGALSTVQCALDAGRDVLAMPGSRRNPSAAGTNALLRDGAIALVEPRDLFVALGRAAPVDAQAGNWRAAAVPLSALAERVCAAFVGEPATLDDLIVRTELAAGEVAGAIRELERIGRITRERGRLWLL